MKHLIFGCGYLGGRVAARWTALGHDVSAVVRREDHATQLADVGVRPKVADLDKPAAIPSRLHADCALFSLPSDVTLQVLESHAELLDVARIVIVGTTGVYGDAGGEWVDETTPPAPTRPGGKAALAVERYIADSALATRTTILRTAGLYGPDRVPFSDKIKSGEAIPAVESGWLNLIHVDDAADVIVAIGSRAPSDREAIFNATDGHPVIRREYYVETARLLSAPAPRFKVPPPGDPRAARAKSNRRVSSARLWNAIDLSPRYPTFREGLAAILGPRP